MADTTWRRQVISAWLAVVVPIPPTPINLAVLAMAYPVPVGRADEQLCGSDDGDRERHGG